MLHFFIKLSSAKRTRAVVLLLVIVEAKSRHSPNVMDATKITTVVTMATSKEGLECHVLGLYIDYMREQGCRLIHSARGLVNVCLMYGICRRENNLYSTWVSNTVHSECIQTP